MRSLGEGRVRRAAKALLPAAMLAMGLAGGLVPTSAQAQFFDWGNGWGNGGGWNGGDWSGMGPGQVYRTLAEHGFRIIAPLRRNGAVFVAEVVDRRGRRERLIVASADGQILQRFILDEQRLPRSAGLPGGDIEQQMERADRGDVFPPVPPASIPDVGRYGADGNADGDTVIEPLRPRPAPRIVTRPLKPRYVERTPDLMQTEPDPSMAQPTQPTRLKAKPSQPLRLPGASDVAVDRPGVPATVTASRPTDALTVPASASPATAPAPAASAAGSGAPARMRDPLAIPGRETKSAEPAKASASAAGSAPTRVVPGPVTAAPAAPKPVVASPPSKSKDVPVAPLD